jgi:O-antigen/teichoic acid export membrane protein
LNVVLVAQGLLYRLAVHRFARRREGVRGRLGVFVLLSLGVAAAAVVGVVLAGPWAERLLFGRAAALPALQGPLIWILLVHSLNYPLAGLLVGSGRVRSQLAVSAASAAVLVAALLLLPDRGKPWSYALALSIATSAAVVGRLIAARPLLRPPP